MISTNNDWLSVHPWLVHHLWLLMRHYGLVPNKLRLFIYLILHLTSNWLDWLSDGLALMHNRLRWEISLNLRLNWLQPIYDHWYLEKWLKFFRLSPVHWDNFLNLNFAKKYKYIRKVKNIGTKIITRFLKFELLINLKEVSEKTIVKKPTRKILTLYFE